MILAIDIGGTSVKLGVLDDQGNCLMQTSVPTLDAAPEALADRLAEALKDSILLTMMIFHFRGR